VYKETNPWHRKQKWTQDKTLRDTLTHLEACGVLGRPRGGLLGRADVRKLSGITGEVAISFLVLEISAGRKLLHFALRR